jgi:hypothetical protein
MTSVPDAPAPNRAEPELALLVLIAVWLAHVSAGYAIDALHCHRHFLEGELAGVETVRVVLVVLTLGAVAVVGLIGLRALRDWSALDGGDGRDPNGRRSFSSALTAMAAVLFLLYAVWSLLPTLTGDPCG